MKRYLIDGQSGAILIILVKVKKKNAVSSGQMYSQVAEMYPMWWIGDELRMSCNLSTFSLRMDGWLDGFIKASLL